MKTVSVLSVLALLISGIWAFHVPQSDAAPRPKPVQKAYTTAGTAVFIQKCESSCIPSVPQAYSQICTSVCRCTIEKVQQKMPFEQFAKESQNSNSAAFSQVVNECMSEVIQQQTMK